MLWIMIMVIAVASMATNTYQSRLKHLEKKLKLEQELIQNQIKLEQIKHENYKLETTRLRLELQDDLNKAPSKTELLDYFEQHNKKKSKKKRSHGVD